MSVMFQRWDPWAELAGLHSTMERIFGDAFGTGGRQAGEGNQGRRWSAFLPVNVIEAHVDNGLLTVLVPKTAAAQPKRIEIGSGAARPLVGAGTSS